MRILTRFALPFAGAMVLCRYVLPPGWRLWCAVAALLAALAAVLAGRRWKALLLPSLLGLALGLVWYSGYAAWAFAPADALAGTEDTAEVTVLTYPEETDYGWYCLVRAEGVRGKAAFYTDEDLSALVPGTRLETAVRYADIRELDGWTSQGVFLRLYGRGTVRVLEPGDRRDLRYLPQRLAKSLRQAVERVYDGPERGLILALLTGEREDLDDQSLSDLEESGLLHITAVSGLHCGMLLAALGCLLFRRRRLTALLGYPALLLYAVMVGLAPSVVRACVMAGFLLLADLAEREADPLTSLSGAAVVILLANPFAVASYSFQLSFASVLGLLVVSPRLHRLLSGGEETGRRSLLRRCRTALAGPIAASLGAMTFTAPLSALYFRFLPLLSWLANLLVLWLMPALFVGALALTPLAAAVPALGFLAELPAALARYVLWAAGLVAHLPGHAVYFTGLTALFWLAYVYAMLILCAVSRDRPRKYAVAALCAALTLSAAVRMPARAVEGDVLTAVAVDVGQGACTLLSSGGETVLVDCGSLNSPLGAGTAGADAMAAYGWDRLDAVVLTHYHQDHAGGLGELLARVPVERLYLPQLKDSGSQSDLQAEVLRLAERYGAAVSFVEEPGVLPLGEQCALTLYPPLTSGEVNEEGLTVLCSAGAFDLLITGDMASATEKRLVETYDLPEVEVLLVGHHGSRYASSYELLEETAPQVGIISVGENRYGHPTAEAMDRCVKAGMELYRTDLQGNILIRVRQ